MKARRVSSRVWRLVRVSGFAAMALAVQTVEAGAGGNAYPCGLATAGVLDVIEWQFAASPDGLALDISVRMNAEMANRINDRPTATAITELSGHIVFLGKDGRSVASSIGIVGVDRPITADATYVFHQQLPQRAEYLRMMASPKGEFRVLACAAHWRYDNGDEWIAN
jgi:hypothetical protein